MQISQSEEAKLRGEGKRWTRPFMEARTLFVVSKVRRTSIRLEIRLYEIETSPIRSGCSVHDYAG